MAKIMQPTSFSRQPLDVILSGGGTVRVLRALLDHGGQLSVSRIASDAKVTPDGVRRILDDLVRLGIVKLTGTGHARLYQAVSGHPLVDGFDKLFAAERKRFKDMLGEIGDAALKQPQILAAWLFGSVARYSDGPNSDLDIAAVISGDVDQAADHLREAISEIAATLGYQVSITAMAPEDVLKHNQTKSMLWDGLVTDAIPLKGDSPRQFAKKLQAGK